MTRSEWSALAVALAELRSKLIKHVDASRTSNGKARHIERVFGVDLASRTICRAIRSRSSRFDSRRFMRLTRMGAATK